MALRSPPKNRATIAITRGDAGGIGPEVVAKALADSGRPRDFSFEILGVETGRGIKGGKATLASAQAALAALREGVQGCRGGRFAALVTGPVQKETLAQIDPGFVGQTEFLARQCGRPDGEAVMVLTDPKLTVALATNHCSLREALERLNPAQIVYVALRVEEFLKKTGIARPRLALAGVNPHAGEHGLFGDEEARLLSPALATLRAGGMAVTGPHSPDTVFHHAVQGAFDAVICPYHDQGLIPFKLVAFHSGVNVTLGLPMIRTSPDHGTALGIAGKGVADHRSMLAAMRLACRLARAGRVKNL